MTPKQDVFCRAYVETGNASEAYRRAYNTDDMKPSTVNRKAVELLENGKITARLDELQRVAQKRHEITVDSLIAELEAARMKAMGNSRGVARLFLPSWARQNSSAS